MTHTFKKFQFIQFMLNALNKKASLNLTHDRHIFTSYMCFGRVPFKLSDIGEGIREVQIKEWFVKEGDRVSQFDNICEVQSDKASVTITSRFDGVITKLYYKTDDTALVGKPLVDIETDEDVAVIDHEDKSEEAKNEPSKAPVEPQPKEKFIQNTEPDSLINEVVTEEGEHIADYNYPLCIPSVRRLAKEHRVDLTQVCGTGKNGRILKEDILAYINKPDAKPTLNVQSSTSFVLEDKIEPIKGYRRAMVKTMSESLKIPHFVYSDEIKVTNLSKIRKEINSLKQLNSIKITFMPFFVKAASNALLRYPVLNASVDEKCANIIYHKNHNIGIAMDTQAGLVVPVIKNVQDLSVVEIAEELNRLISSGKKGSFSPSDLTGGTFAISNIGIIGGTYTKPVILPPQVAIIALGASQKVPRFDNEGNVVPEEIINISGAADHRVIDGASMANFTQVLKKQIENPYLLFLNL